MLGQSGHAFIRRSNRNTKQKLIDFNSLRDCHSIRVVGRFGFLFQTCVHDGMGMIQFKPSLIHLFCAVFLIHYLSFVDANDTASTIFIAIFQLAAVCW